METHQPVAAMADTKLLATSIQAQFAYPKPALYVLLPTSKECFLQKLKPTHIFTDFQLIVNAFLPYHWLPTIGISGVQKEYKNNLMPQNTA